MRKLLAAILLLCGTSFATTPVTGNLKDLTGTAVGSTNGSFARFYLRGCGKNQPRVPASTSAIAPHAGTNGIFFFDIPADSSGALSATVYSTRDAAGTGNGEIECGGSFKAVWYGVVFYANGVPGPETPFHAQSGVTLSLPTATPLSVLPVVTAPDGLDSIYARIDGANQPFTGALSVPTSITGTTGTFTVQAQSAPSCSGFCPTVDGGDLLLEAGSGDHGGLNGNIIVGNYNNFRPLTDNALDLGVSFRRWATYYGYRLNLATIATPATPATGTIVAYGKTSTKTLCSKDDAGVETCYGAGGGGTPGGSDTQIQFNDGEAFGGDSALTFNKATSVTHAGGRLRVGGNLMIEPGNGSGSDAGSFYFNPDDYTTPTKGSFWCDGANSPNSCYTDENTYHYFTRGTSGCEGGRGCVAIHSSVGAGTVSATQIGEGGGFFSTDTYSHCSYESNLFECVTTRSPNGSTITASNVGDTSANVGGFTVSATAGNAKIATGISVSATADSVDKAVAVKITAGRLQLAQETPASSAATCTAGQLAVDASFIYVCTASNTWKRAALSSF